MSSMYGGRGAPAYSSGGTAGGSATGKVGGYKVGQLQQFTPEQMDLFRSLFSHVMPGSQLSNLAGGDEEAFKQIEGPALRQFSGQLGGLASRFSGMGGLGGRHSSGFQNTATQAASEFSQDLASKRQGLQRQAIMDLMGLSSDLLGQKPYDQFLYPEKEKQPWWKKALGGALPLGGAALGGLFGGPAGAALGGRLGSAAGQAFQ
jgi:hypothetical protein